MKNLQKLALAVLVAVMAIGFSAFKNSNHYVNGKLATPFTYTNINYITTPNSTNPSDYRYLPDLDCVPSSSTITCKAEWLEPSVTEPAENSQPLGTFSIKVANGTPDL